MKKYLLFSLILTIISVITINAQDTITFKVGVDCPGIGTALFSESTSLEGQSYTLPAHNLPAEYTNLQLLYNALVGSTFTIEDGAINENIRIEWILNELDCTPGGGYILPENGALLLFNSHYVVSTKVDGEWIEYNGDYNFLNGKKAVLSIKNTQEFQDFRLAVPLYTNMISFVFEVPGGYTSDGIELTLPSDTTDVNDFWVIKASHLSIIVGGEKGKLTAIEDNRSDNNIPSDFILKQNYPNPFNPSTFIEYSVPQRTNVQINVYNILGVRVATLFEGTKEAGNYRLSFNAAELASGLYIYEMKTSSFIQSRKMLYLK